MSLVSLLLIQSHCSSDPECSSRVQISSQPDPQMPSGALIHVPRYLGNLPFRVWKKMQDIVQNSESDCRRSELTYTHTGNDAILTDFSIMCEEPDHLLYILCISALSLILIYTYIYINVVHISFSARFSYEFLEIWFGPHTGHGMECDP